MMFLSLAFFLGAAGVVCADDSFAPCWRGDSATTFQSWAFGDSNNPAGPTQYTNNNGAPVATLTLGSFATGWKNSSIGGRTGVWDMGRAATVSIALPESAGATNSSRYIYVQATYFQDSFAFDVPTVSVPGATFISSSVVNNQSAPPGNWKTLQSVWLLQPAGSSETVVLSGSATKGFLLDQVVIDTRTAAVNELVPTFRPCWRGQSGSTFQGWAFGISNSVLGIPADAVTNTYGAPTASIVLGAFSAGYISEDPFLGCVQGIWDLGRHGTMTLSLPLTNAPSSGSYQYLQVQVSQFRDSSIYVTNAAITLAGGTRLSVGEQLVQTNTYGGQWVVEKSVWRVGSPGPLAASVVITGGINGALIDQVVVDTLYFDQPTPVDVVLNADTGLCSRSNVTWTVPGVDGCAVTNVTCSPSSGSTFPVGSSLVTYVLQDGYGLSYTNNFHVVIIDDQPPTLVCPADIIAAKNTTDCGAYVTFAPLATDNCGISNVVSVPPSGSLFPVGVTTVSSVAYDIHGLTSSVCQFQVRVVDFTGDLLANRPCWRGQPATTFQQWAFAVSNNPALLSPDLVTNAYGLPNGSIVLGQFSAGYIDQDPFLGCVQGVWDLGQGGEMTLAIPNAVVSSTNAFKYVLLQVSQFRDSSIYTNNATISLAGSTRISQQEQVVQTNAFGGAWVVEKTVWRLGPPSPNTESIVLTGGTYGSLIDQVVVDTLVVDQPVATNLLFSADASLCAKTNVSWNLPVVDGCVITNLVSSAPVGSSFSVGTNVVTYVVRDSLGGVYTNHFSITVTDDEFPVALTQNISVNLDSLGLVSLTAAQVDNGSSDNCGIASRTVSPASFSCANLGSNGVTFVVTDIHGHSATNTAIVYVNDAQAPTLTNLFAIQASADVKDCANTALQGAVLISVQSFDNCSLAGNPTVVLTNGAVSEVATFVNQSPAGTFNYVWNVTNITANGTWLATVSAADSSQVAITNFTICVNKAQITGQVQLQSFVGTKTVPLHSRTIVFVATTNNPIAGTNVLLTWTTPVTNVSGDTFSFKLTGVPLNANGLSAKTAWNLRSKLVVSFDTNLQGVVNFTTTNSWLRGGDITGDNLVNTLDNLQIRGHFGLTNFPAADINGDGIVNTLDNLVMRQWFGKRGDGQ